MTPVLDPFEARAQHAAQAAHDAVKGVEMTGISVIGGAPVRRRPSTRAAWVAAALVLVVAAAAFVAVRALQGRDQGLPAFDPKPLPAARPFHARLTPGVSFAVPKHYRLSANANTADLTVLNLEGTAGGLVVMRVRSYATSAKHDLVAAMVADDRLRILSRRSSVVGGEKATRLVVAPLPGVTSSDWLCPYGSWPCFGLDPTGGSTVYLFSHRGTRYALVGGAVNDQGARTLRRVVDGAAATWQW